MVFGFKPKPSDAASPPAEESKGPSVDSDQQTANAQRQATEGEASTSENSERGPKPSSSWLVQLAHAFGFAPAKQDKDTVYTTGIPGIVEISVTPKEHQRYVIGGYAARNPDMMRPHRCNDRMEDFILATFYSTSTTSPWRDFSYTVKMMYKCMMSNPGEEPSDAFKFLDEKAYHRRINRAMAAYQAEFDRARSASVGVKEDKKWWSAKEAEAGGSGDEQQRRS